MEMLKMLCPSAAVLCKTGMKMAIYIFNKTFRLIFLVHNGSILRNRMASKLGYYTLTLMCNLIAIYSKFLLHPVNIPQALLSKFSLCHQVFKQFTEKNVTTEGKTSKKRNRSFCKSIFISATCLPLEFNGMDFKTHWRSIWSELWFFR